MNKSIELSDLVKYFEDHDKVFDLSNATAYSQIQLFLTLPKTKGVTIKRVLKDLGFDPEEVENKNKKSNAEFLIANVEIIGIANDLTADAPEEAEELESEEELETPAQIIVEETQPVNFNVSLALIRNNIDLNNINLIQSDNKFDIRTINLYENTPLTIKDNFSFKKKVDDFDFYNDVVFMLKYTDNSLIGVGHIEVTDKKSYIIIDERNIDFNAFDDSTMYRIGFIDKNDSTEFTTELKISKLYTKKCNINYNKLNTTTVPLCIDFGTSNTASGMYDATEYDGESIKLVTFSNLIDENSESSYLFPTIVYVENCSKTDDIEYLFGYEAKKKVIEYGYETQASVFFEIKRWINTLDSLETINDILGNSIEVTRGSIVKAYILHVINLSSQHFKLKFTTLHFSAPVKLKEKFNTELNKLFIDEEYNIIKTSQSIDEGFAIVYNTFLEILKEKRIRGIDDTGKYDITILDCGGGTTDLVECSIYYNQLDTAKKLEIKTKFVNGNSNYGGNNITFRILQLIKIKLAEKYEKIEDFDINHIIIHDETEILNQIEANQNNQNDIYKKFDQLYETCEAFIPTKFVDNQEFEFDDELKCIKRNYYYLWQLAEKLKIKFYEDEIVSVGGGDDDILKNLDKAEHDFIYLVVDGELIKKSESITKEIRITINEIKKAIYGDIYGILNELLSVEELNSKINQDDCFYRLAGQSCRINLFIELLKEFIPGRMLRSKHRIDKNSSVIESNSLKYKLDCIKGCIAYVRDKDVGKIKPIIKPVSPKLIYDVYIKKDDQLTQLLSREFDTELKYDLLTSNTTQIVIMVKNITGSSERTPLIHRINSKFLENDIRINEFFDTVKINSIETYHKTLDDLATFIQNLNPDESDNQKYIRIAFAVPSTECYGMNIYIVGKNIENKNKDHYALIDKIYVDYEDESTKSFFDGKR